MVEEGTNENVLWVHQEEAIISARTHDIWAFTPEFLVTEEIIPGHWICQRATRTQNNVNIEFGPTHWRMTENNLWVTQFRDCPLDDQFSENSNIPELAFRYLGTVPYLPSPDLWLRWRISTIHPDCDGWMRDNFSNPDWADKLDSLVLEPTVVFTNEEALFRIGIKAERVQRDDQPPLASAVFDCYVLPTQASTAGEILDKSQNWGKLLKLTEHAIRLLLDGGNSE